MGGGGDKNEMEEVQSRGVQWNAVAQRRHWMEGVYMGGGTEEECREKCMGV
jgi:hypothetical protein